MCIKATCCATKQSAGITDNTAFFEFQTRFYCFFDGKMRREKRYKTAEALDMILNDSETNVFLEDSSSEDEIQPEPEVDSDSDYQLPPDERYPQHFTPTAQKRARKAPAAPGAEAERWHGKEEQDIKPAPFKFAPSRKPGPTFDTTAAWIPLSLFQLFFSTPVIRTIIDNTNANAAK
ncbi:uncharacterized protein V6R79_008307 [Siganus canaliculatus]